MAMVDMQVEEEIEKQKEAPNASSKLIVWLVVISFSLLFLPLYLMSTTIQQDNESLTVTLESVYLSLTATPVPNVEEVALRDKYIKLQNSVIELENLNTSLEAAHIGWPQIMSQINGYDGYRIKLSSITQSGYQIVIIGEANDETDVNTYVEKLRLSELFNSVSIRAVMLKSIQPTPTSKTSAAKNAPAGDLTASAIKYVEFTLMIDIRRDES